MLNVASSVGVVGLCLQEALRGRGWRLQEPHEGGEGGSRLLCGDGRHGRVLRGVPDCLDRAIQFWLQAQELRVGSFAGAC